ncbi:MAG: 30S ribosomal protein S16 [Janthinobacterium lividum]
MAVKIRLKRMGKMRAPHYRIVVADSRNKRDGRAIEEIGLYNPMTDPSTIEIKSERALYWLGVGAQPTEQVAALLKVTGDWQKFKGLPGTEGTYRVPTPNTKPVPAGAPAKVVAPVPAAADTVSADPVSVDTVNADTASSES